MESTAAPNDNSVVRAADATAASFSEGELTAVGTPQQVETRFPSRKRGLVWPSKKVSLEESVGEVRFGKGSESVIERGFVGFLGTETVGFSGDQF